jgi:hypothetical protein
VTRLTKSGTKLVDFGLAKLAQIAERISYGPRRLPGRIVIGSHLFGVGRV